jgi:hypothetical protein
LLAAKGKLMESILLNCRGQVDMVKRQKKKKSLLHPDTDRLSVCIVCGSLPEPRLPVHLYKLYEDNRIQGALHRSGKWIHGAGISDPVSLMHFVGHQLLVL